MAKKIFLLLALILLTFTSAEAADDLNFEPVATTYTEGNSASLTLIRMKDNGSIYFVATDSSSNTMAFVPYSRKLYDFYLTKDEYGGWPPLIFTMALPMAERGQLDDDLGEWQQTVHLVPVYAMFHVEGGQVICDDKFFSAESLQSTHYHATVQNPNHTRLIEILMTHMPRLHETLDAKGINLP